MMQNAPPGECGGNFSARALVKKAQEPGINYRKLIFSGMIPGHLSRRIPERPQNLPCAFFLIKDGRHHVTSFLGIPQLFTFRVKKNILVSLTMF